MEIRLDLAVGYQHSVLSAEAEQDMAFWVSSSSAVSIEPALKKNL